MVLKLNRLPESKVIASEQKELQKKETIGNLAELSEDIVSKENISKFRKSAADTWDMMLHGWLLGPIRAYYKNFSTPKKEENPHEQKDPQNRVEV